MGTEAEMNSVWKQSEPNSKNSTEADQYERNINNHTNTNVQTKQQNQSKTNIPHFSKRTRNNQPYTNRSHNTHRVKRKKKEKKN